LTPLVVAFLIWFVFAVDSARGMSPQSHRSDVARVQYIIRYVFGPYGDQAVRVARCESGLSIWARNGQYENLFQMGYSERQHYGWHRAGSPAWMATLAAWRYFVASGYSWRAWSCKP
jgi:hypothetical protein